MNRNKSTSTALLSVAPDIWGIAAIEIVKYILSADEEFSRFYASIFTIVCATLGLNRIWPSKIIKRKIILIRNF